MLNLSSKQYDQWFIFDKCAYKQYKQTKGFGSSPSSYSRWKKDVMETIQEMDNETKRGWEAFYKRKLLKKQIYFIKAESILSLFAFVLSAIVFVTNTTLTAMLSSESIVYSYSESKNVRILREFTNTIYNAITSSNNTVSCFVTVTLLLWGVLSIAKMVQSFVDSERKFYYSIMLNLFRENKRG